MSIRIPVAMATSVVALLCASTSFAQDTTEQQTTTSTSTTTTAPAQTTTPVQPAPVQPTTQQQPQQQPQQQQPQPQQPQQPIIIQQQPAVGTTTTTQAPYEAPATDRYTERTVTHRPNRSLLSTGAGIFVLSYGSSVVAGAISDRDEDKRLFIPVVGPWLDLGQRDCTARGCGSNEDVAKAMIITSGVVQGAGVLVALSSLIIPEKSTVEERTTTASAKKPEKPSVHVLPVSFAAGAGVGAVGRF